MAENTINSIIVPEENEVMIIETIEAIPDEYAIKKNILILGRAGSVCYRSKLIDAYPTCALTFVGNQNIDSLPRSANELCDEYHYDLVIYMGMHDLVLKKVGENMVYRLLDEMPDRCIQVANLIEVLSAHFVPAQILICWPLLLNLTEFNREQNRMPADQEMLEVRMAAGEAMLQEMMRRMALDAPATYVPVGMMTIFRQRGRGDKRNDLDSSTRFIRLLHEFFDLPVPTM